MTETTCSTQHWTCRNCGTPCVRPATRGTRPKYCGDPCQKAGWAQTAPPRTCRWCGSTYRVGDPRQRYCSRPCATNARRKPKPKPTRTPHDPRGPLRRAYEDGDRRSFFATLETKVAKNGECWEWQGKTNSGYAVMRFGKRNLFVHRASLEMKHDAKLGTQAAHHTCANTRCVNPEHLEPVTHAANTAEMLARAYMLDRITALEAALAEHAPGHPLLDEISTPPGALG